VTEESDPARDAAIEEAAQMITRYAALPPDVAAAFVEMLERVRRDVAWAKVTDSVRQMAADNAVRSILRRQALAMDAIQGSFNVVLLPDFSGDDFSELESAVISLLPATTGEVQEIERTVARASSDPESQNFIARLVSHFPDSSQIGTMATWTGFLAVAAYLLKIAPEMDGNRIAMLAVIVAVWTVLVQRTRP
jgi:hypothetical protein